MTYDRDSKGLDDGERNQGTCSGVKKNWSQRMGRETAPQLCRPVKGLQFHAT